MYQSLEHKEVVILEIRKNEPKNVPRTIRVSVGDDYAEWAQEIVTTTIRTGGADVTSDNIRGKWLHPDTLSLCLSGIEKHQQLLTVNVTERTHTINAGNCPFKI